MPKKFSQVHPRFKTPAFATIITGFLVGVPSLFLPSSLMTDLTSIGTLFAFVLVCFGVLTLPKISHIKKSAFRLPYINGKFLMPIITTLFIAFTYHRINNAFYHLGEEGFQEILFLVFIAIMITTSILAFFRNYSIIPIIGALSCLYLLTEIPAISWLWFFVWMGFGLLIYGFYGKKNSKLQH